MIFNLEKDILSYPSKNYFFYAVRIKVIYALKYVKDEITKHVYPLSHYLLISHPFIYKSLFTDITSFTSTY